MGLICNKIGVIAYNEIVKHDDMYDTAVLKHDTAFTMIKYFINQYPCKVKTITYVSNNKGKTAWMIVNTEENINFYVISKGYSFTVRAAVEVDGMDMLCRKIFYSRANVNEAEAKSEFFDFLNQSFQDYEFIGRIPLYGLFFIDNDKDHGITYLKEAREAKILTSNIFTRLLTDRILDKITNRDLYNSIRKYILIRSKDLGLRERMDSCLIK